MHAIFSSKPLSDIEQEAQFFLDEIGVQFESFYRGETKQDQRVVDSWLCKFKVPLQLKNSKRSEEKAAVFDFFTGVGHRKNGAAVYPCAAAVLYCVVLDAEANDYSFFDWCDSFGYDSDSRKAFATYEACCMNARKLGEVFNSQQIQTLKNILQDY